MNVRTSLAVLLLALSFYASAQSNADLEQAKARLFQCYAKSVHELDDGATDVTTVAGAVVSNCPNEFNYLISFAASNPRVDLAEVYRLVRAGHIEMLIPFILKRRAAARQ